MKDEFVSTVSHELRTPLSSIRAFSRSSRTTSTWTAAAPATLGDRGAGDERLSRLVDKVLDFTKIESGAYQWAKRAARPGGRGGRGPRATASSRATGRSRSSARCRGRHAIPGPGPASSRFVINLLSNALKYCEPESGRVAALARSDAEARLEVADNGPGIRPEERARVFEKFHQIRDAARGKPQGPAWAWQSARRSSKTTAAASGSKASPAAAPVHFHAAMNPQEDL